MSNFNYRVFCTFQFTALHYCPPNVCPSCDNYLVNKHRHVFHVRCEAPVGNDNRDIEFIGMKHSLETYARQNWHNQNIGTMSCEQIAHHLLVMFPQLDSVEVSEDGENGAIAYRSE